MLACPRCDGEDDAESLDTSRLCVAGELGSALEDERIVRTSPVEAPVPPADDLDDAPPPWREVAGEEDLPPARAIDVRLALGLVERGVPIDRIVPWLLLAGHATTGDLSALLQNYGIVEADVHASAFQEASCGGRDAVRGFRDWGCAVLSSHARLALRAPDLPETIGPYRVVSRLGRGGMAEVFLVFRPGFDRDLALKRLRPFEGGDLRRLARFVREARALARLRHAAIVPIVDAGLEREEPYLVLDHVAGIDLSRLARRGLTFEESARLLARVARALDFAHRAGVLHRDVKPQNVLVDLEGDPFLLDFGLARIEEDLYRMTISRERLGSPRYMPPESIQASDAFTAASDVYSLGAVLYECLTRRPPFPGDSLEDVFRRILAGEFASPRELAPTVPAALERTCLRALSRQPADRHPSAAEFAAEIEAWLRAPARRVGMGFLAAAFLAGLALGAAAAALALLS
ncbi:MAG: serine/threonine protein kinase [Planctomycetes bacterium]|nr:serine/threonine protein kinase [Planctomycetota bacterium]